MMHPQPLDVTNSDWQRIMRQSCRDAYYGAGQGILKSLYGGIDIPDDVRMRLNDAADNAGRRYPDRGSQAVVDAAEAGALYGKGVYDSTQRQG